ncbi:uncharacterized protein LOC111385063 [Olea europaea var. sylvestris]|uniref:uncharacterized protein LOC111385063 n=1 Tax=Olea europaea var. sylvestris TaxID=158386 RepID=UPI000C1D8B24|nr:uncharacterized protein LOC111385063 [Olea europaea var. sylvestris]
MLIYLGRLDAWKTVKIAKATMDKCGLFYQRKIWHQWRSSTSFNELEQAVEHIILTTAEAINSYVPTRSRTRLAICTERRKLDSSAKIQLIHLVYDRPYLTIFFQITHQKTKKIEMQKNQ